MPVATWPIARLATATIDQHDVHRIRELAERDRPDARRRLGRQLIRAVRRQPPLDLLGVESLIGIDRERLERRGGVERVPPLCLRGLLDCAHADSLVAAFEPCRHRRVETKPPRAQRDSRRFYQARSRPSRLAAGSMSGRRRMRKPLTSPIRLASTGTRSATWRERFRASVLMRRISASIVGRLVDEELVELRVAHHLGAVLERGRDLILLRRRDHGAVVDHVREAEREHREHEAAGHRESERQAERTRRGVHAGGFADPVFFDG